MATGAALVALIFTFGPLSGAHFNPVVTAAEAWQGRFAWRDVPGYLVAQIAGAVAGVAVANLMFGEPAFAFSGHARQGPTQALSEAVATFGLVLVIACCVRNRPTAVPVAVASYIVAAYWFTASTSFANPAVTIARSLTNTFAGIRPGDVPVFGAAQVVGAAAAVLLVRWLAPDRMAERAAPGGRAEPLQPTGLGPREVA
jgi:glycerol uptake facilitator-like aquaporin